MRFFLNRIKIIIFFTLLFINKKIFMDPLYLNKANPFPIFSSAGRYDFLTKKLKSEAIKLLNDDDSYDENIEGEIFHVSIMPYFQTSYSGTDFNGRSSVTTRNITNQEFEAGNQASVPLVELNSSQTSSSNSTSGTNTPVVLKTYPTPISAVPEPFNFFALFYPWSNQDSIEPWLYNITTPPNPEPIDFKPTPIVPTGKTYGNLVSKIIARYIGYSNVPAYYDATSTNTSVGDPISDSLYYDYSNYTNPWYYIMASPQNRDNEKLIGYGYYDLDYKKFGIRSLIEVKSGIDWGFKIYTGFSNIDIDSINCINTTVDNQGPVATYMFARYSDTVASEASTSDLLPGDEGGSAPYVAPNIYPIVQYKAPVVNGLMDNPLNNWVKNTNIAINNRIPDQFKTLYVQNIQNNLDNLGDILGQDFRPYHEQSFDDTTFEVFYRKMILYNQSSKKRLIGKNINNEEVYGSNIFMPTFAMHFTVPIAPQIPGNKIFAIPIDNNGHWEYGANIGIEFDFITSIILGTDIGFSMYSSKNYCNTPVPTKQLEEGLFTYKANYLRQPGYSFTFGLGMQADKFLDKISFFGEYRIIRHNKDSFYIQSMVYPNIKIVYMDDTHVQVDDEVDNYDSANNIDNGVMYLNTDQAVPYPTINNVVIRHMEETSAWTVQMINIMFKFDIMENISLGVIWQQPFTLKNALNTSTFGISLEIYM